MRRDVLVPELGLGEMPIRVCRWFCEPGHQVVQGDRLVQLVSGSVSVDLPSPITGVFLRSVVRIDGQVQAGERLAVIEVEEDD